MTRVCFFHTVAALSGRFEDLAADSLTDAEWYHAVDESVLDDMLAAGKLTPDVTQRICAQLALAERADADVILDTCSSTSPAVDVARHLVEIPIVKIDDPMTERAVELGDRIAVVATAASTLDPSRELVERKAEEAGRDVEIETILVDDAFEARRSGDVNEHDRLITDALEDAVDDVGVIVLAQASMSHLETSLADRVSVPVLSSPDLAMERVTELAARR
jgi:Asp/Glu/hydantoin racemase